MSAAFITTATTQVETRESFLYTQKKSGLRTHFAVGYYDARISEKSVQRTENIRAAFNSPFRPFVLATTSIGQEGLDFHTYCRKIMRTRWNEVSLRANSIGAYFSMLAFGDAELHKALFVSPIVDIEKLIRDMMTWAGVTEAELHEKGEILTGFGETLSWRYLSWVREHPSENWHCPTAVLYAGQDSLTSREMVEAFAKAHDEFIFTYFFFLLTFLHHVVNICISDEVIFILCEAASFVKRFVIKDARRQQKVKWRRYSHLAVT